MILVPYASGDGACHFSFIEGGKAVGKKPTFDDVKSWLQTNKNAAKYRTWNWRPVRINDEVVLVAHVVRVNENTLAVHGKEFQYEIDVMSQLWQEARHLTDYAISIQAENEDGKYTVKNYGIRIQIRHFLMNEDSLTSQPPEPIVELAQDEFDWI